MLNSYSGAWEDMFVELEPVGDPVFTKAGVPGRRLAGALKQVEDWSPPCYQSLGLRSRRGGQKRRPVGEQS